MHSRKWHYRLILNIYTQTSAVCVCLCVWYRGAKSCRQTSLFLGGARSHCRSWRRSSRLQMASRGKNQQPLRRTTSGDTSTDAAPQTVSFYPARSGRRRSCRSERAPLGPPWGCRCDCSGDLRGGGAHLSPPFTWPQVGSPRWEGVGPTWVVILVHGDRGRLQEAHSEALLQPEDQDLWLFVRHLGDNGEDNLAQRHRK